MRLIDADAVLRELKSRYPSMPFFKELREKWAIRTEGYIEAGEIIMNAPTVDAVSVVHGKWRHLKGDEWLCSNCGYVVWTEGSWEHPLERGKDYCEHCGAEMKGANNE